MFLLWLKKLKKIYLIPEGETRDSHTYHYTVVKTKKFIQKNDFDNQKGQNLYLRHLTLEGVKSKYKEIDNDLKERIDFELDVISKTGYPGYFLIVQDFISAARNMGVSVGPGRGSAAGSVVAYALGITSIDPISACSASMFEGCLLSIFFCKRAPIPA